MRVYENASLKDPRPKIVGTIERHMPKSEAHQVNLIAIPCQQADICRQCEPGESSHALTKSFDGVFELPAK
jgi:hypothetical protein